MAKKDTSKSPTSAAANSVDADSGRTSSRKSANKRKYSRNRGKRNTQQTANETLARMTVETPVGASPSLVFPTDSASMQAFGNVITTPGQDNFISSFTRMQRAADITDTPVELQIAPNQSTVKRAANAMVFDVVHYFGNMVANSKSWVSPLDMAAMNLKQFIDTSFGTNTSYDPQDLMLYLQAVSAVFPLIAELKRDLRLAVTYQQNQYPQFVPQGLFTILEIGRQGGTIAEGALWTAAHLREFIDRLNMSIVSFNRLPMPPEILIFGYNDYLFDHIFMDSPDAQTAQLYLFRNSATWEYEEELPESITTALKMRKVTDYSIGAKLDTLESVLKKITALRTSSTAMLQNLFNAYGSHDTVQVPTVDMTDLRPVEFVYDPNILTMVENMNLTSFNDTVFSHIYANHAESSINGHVWARGDSFTAPGMYWNLPLQFHKPVSEVTKDDIGWALRMHPVFLEQKKFNAWSSDDADITEHSHVTCDGYCGFAFCTGFAVAVMDDTGTVHRLRVTSRITGNGQGADAMYAGQMTQFLHDFVASPMLVQCDRIGTADTMFTYKLYAYTSSRDVEVTYRLEDIKMHWTYLTQTLWASNVNRNVSGSRTRS